MNPHMRQSFKAAVRPGTPHTQHVLDSLDAIANVAERLTTRAAALKADKNLSEMGQRTKLADEVRTGMLADLAKATRPARIMPAFLKTERGGLRLPPVDRTDVVGEMRRQEMRMLVRKMKMHDRLAAALNPEFAEALLDVPPQVAGIPAERHAQLRAARIEELHGERLKQIDDMGRDYSGVVTLAAVVRQELQQASGLAPGAFSALLEPMERQTDSQFVAPGYGPKPTGPEPQTMFRKEFDALPPADRMALMTGDNPPSIIDFDWDAIWDAAAAEVLGEKKQEPMQ